MANKPNVQSFGFEVEKKGHFEEANLVAVAQEVDFNLFPEVFGINFGLPLVENFGFTSPSILTRTAIPALKGIEIDVAKSAELVGIEIAASFQEDVIHPTWVGIRGIDTLITEPNFAISVTMNSAGLDNYSTARFGLYIGMGNLTYTQLFTEINCLGNFSFGDHYISKLPDGTFPQPSTQYTVGVKLVDEYRNAEYVEEVNTVISSAGNDLLPAPRLLFVDDDTGDSVTVTLQWLTSDVDYSHTEIYRLSGYTTTNAAYKTHLTSFTNVGESFQITGLKRSEEVKLVASCIDTNAIRGYTSRIYSIVVAGVKLADSEETPLSALLPSISGDSIGVGIKYPFEIAEGVVQNSSGVSRLQETIIYILRTVVASRLMHPNFGQDLGWMPFEIATIDLNPIIQDIVIEAIETNEPRVKIDSVEITNYNKYNSMASIAIAWFATNQTESGSFMVDLQISGG